MPNKGTKSKHEQPRGITNLCQFRSTQLLVCPAGNDKATERKTPNQFCSKLEKSFKTRGTQVLPLNELADLVCLAITNK